MNLLEFIAVIIGIVCIAGAWGNWQRQNQAQMEKDRLLMMSREETKRWEILTGIVVNKPASRIPPAPPNPHRKD